MKKKNNIKVQAKKFSDDSIDALKKDFGFVADDDERQALETTIAELLKLGFKPPKSNTKA